MKESCCQALETECTNFPIFCAETPASSPGPTVQHSTVTLRIILLSIRPSGNICRILHISSIIAIWAGVNEVGFDFGIVRLIGCARVTLCLEVRETRRFPQFAGLKRDQFTEQMMIAQAELVKIGGKESFWACLVEIMLGW
jgi:hypothetical protein